METKNKYSDLLIKGDNFLVEEDLKIISKK